MAHRQPSPRRRCPHAVPSLLFTLTIAATASARGPAEPAGHPAAADLPRVAGHTVHEILELLGARLEGGATAEEREAYARHFDRIDADGDGRHSREEYVVKGSYLNPMARTGIFRAADSDRDGFVTREEYVLNRIITDEAKAIVGSMDRDGDGLVSRAEFVRDARIPERDLRAAVFAALDTSGDGTLAVPEYLRVWGRWARSGTRGATPITVESPGGRFSIRLSTSGGGRPSYSVRWSGRQIIAPSGLGFRLEGEVDWTTGFDPPAVISQSESHGSWKPVWGEHESVPHHCRGIAVVYRRRDPPAELTVEARAYDEGVALRYLVGKGPTGDEIRIASEETEFRFGADHEVWAVTSAQGKYSKVRLSEVRHDLERPCVLETADAKVIAVGEAALVDYARIRVRRSEEAPHALVSRLHGPVVAKTPLTTPWRFVMAGDTPGELLENNYLVLNLNEPCAIEDTSWIRPGKVIREVSLSTEGGKACVDFAVEHGLQYIEYDAGWYGPQGEEASDARTDSRDGLDLQEVLRYARQHGIGVFLYVNRRHLESQLDELLPLYRSWGIAGIKYGFVRHGSQRWTAWLHDAIRKTAAHRMMVDVHDEYRMTGWERTWPSFMTAEGIGGDETRPPHEQVLANLFTRMIAGPADHTFCYYSRHVEETSTHASQLAKSVCFFSPLQFLYWYDRPSSARNEPELEFWRHLPTTWDETRVLHSKIGAYAVIARRKGRDWFVGCLNAVEPRTLDVRLAFLPEGERFVASIYRDDERVRTRTRVGIERRHVDSTTVLEATMGAPGGVAMRIVPAGTQAFRPPGSPPQPGRRNPPSPRGGRSRTRAREGDSRQITSGRPEPALTTRPGGALGGVSSHRAPRSPRPSRDAGRILGAYGRPPESVKMWDHGCPCIRVSSVHLQPPRNPSRTGPP